MQIEIGYDFNNNQFIHNQGYEHNPDEDKILLDLVSKLGGTGFKIEKNSQDYTSLKYGVLDLCRVKYTPKSHWIRIYIGGKERREKYKDDLMFYSQDNKNQVYWISHFSNSLDEYIPILKEAMVELDKEYKKKS